MNVIRSKTVWVLLIGLAAAVSIGMAKASSKPYRIPPPLPASMPQEGSEADKKPAPLPKPLPASDKNLHDPTPPRVQVMIASARHGIPLPVMLAIWERECSGRVRCPEGPGGELTAFQVKPMTAIDAGCAPNWKYTLGAYCAARYLEKLRDYCGPSLSHRLNFYNGRGCVSSSPYSRWVLHRAKDIGRMRVTMINWQSRIGLDE